MHGSVKNNITPDKDCFLQIKKYEVKWKYVSKRVTKQWLCRCKSV